MQARARGRRLGETAFNAPAAGEPPVPPTAHSSGGSRAVCPPPPRPRGRHGSLGKFIAAPQSPRPSGTGAGGAASSLFVQEGRQRGRPRAPALFAGQRCPSAGQEHPGLPAGALRAAVPLTKAESGPSTCALPRRDRRARPGAGRAGGAAPLRAGRGERGDGSPPWRGPGGPPLRGDEAAAVAGAGGCLRSVHLSAAAARPGPRPAPLDRPGLAPPTRPGPAAQRSPRLVPALRYGATLAERPFTAPGLQRRPG